MDNITLQLNSPITEDQWDAITDVDFENTEEILFTTKHKKNVRFVKAQQWIPCSERLPKELVPVNVTWVNKDPEPYYLIIKDKPFTDTAVYYEGKWYWQSATCVDLLKEYGESPADDVAYGIEIVAWMPLPEPYKGDDNG